MGIKERISVLQHSEVSQHRATIVLELRIKGKPEQEAGGAVFLVGSQLHPKEFEVGQDFAAWTCLISAKVMSFACAFF